MLFGPILNKSHQVAIFGEFKVANFAKLISSLDFPKQILFPKTTYLKKMTNWYKIIFINLTNQLTFGISSSSTNLGYS